MQSSSDNDRQSSGMSCSINCPFPIARGKELEVQMVVRYSSPTGKKNKWVKVPIVQGTSTE